MGCCCAAERTPPAGETISKWVPGIRPDWAKNTDPAETRAVFVDEQSCIGCKQCVHLAPATFRIEGHHGRSRVFAQWLNDEDTIATAILSCPVDCIHWVEKDELAALEHVSQRVQSRVDVSVMMAQQSHSDDVFAATAKFHRDRAKLAARRKAAAEQVSPLQVRPPLRVYPLFAACAEQAGEGARVRAGRGEAQGARGDEELAERLRRPRRAHGCADGAGGVGVRPRRGGGGGGRLRARAGGATAAASQVECGSGEHARRWRQRVDAHPARAEHGAQQLRRRGIVLVGSLVRCKVRARLDKH